MSDEWPPKAPSWRLELDGVDGVAIYRIPDPEGTEVGAAGWPETFWEQVEPAERLEADDADQLLTWFRALRPVEWALCHDPPWGLALYASEELRYTVTLCFECCNAEVFDPRGKAMRGMDTQQSSAAALLRFLKARLPLRGDGHALLDLDALDEG